MLHKTIMRSKKFNEASHPHNITQNQWIKWNTSVWTINLEEQIKIPRNRGNHPCPTIPEIYYRLYLFFSSPGDYILDFFCGTGTGGCVAKYTRRNFLGVDLNQDYVKLAKNNIENTPGIPLLTYSIKKGDSRFFPFKENSIDLIVTSPPYFNKIRYSKKKNDISNYMNLQEYQSMLNNAIRNASKALKKSRYIALIIGDAQLGKNMIPIHSMLINKMTQNNFDLTHFWINKFPFNIKKKENRIIGFPTHLYLEFDHEYILVFKKN